MQQQQILADYDYIKQDDFMGLYNKHIKYIKYYQKKIMRNSSDYDDIKQDVFVELFELFKWINKKKIDKNFNFKYFAFQKINAYKKSKKYKNINFIQNTEPIYDEYTNSTQSYGSNLTNMRSEQRRNLICLLKSKENTEDHYFIYDDFPSTLSELDKQIYFKKFVNKDKTKNICQELKMSYAILTRHIVDIENKLRCYIR